MTGIPRIGLLPIMTIPLLAGTCGLVGPAYGPPSGAVAVVDMTNGLSFDAGTVTIRAGETVEWRNRSFFTHTVTGDPSRAKAPAHALLPKGAAPFSAQVCR